MERDGQEDGANVERRTRRRCGRRETDGLAALIERDGREDDAHGERRTGWRR